MTASELAQEAATVQQALRTIEHQLDDVVNEISDHELTEERAHDYQSLMLQYLMLVRRDERLNLLKAYFEQAVTPEDVALFGRLADRWL